MSPLTIEPPLCKVHLRKGEICENKEMKGLREDPMAGNKKMNPLLSSDNMRNAVFSEHLKSYKRINWQYIVKTSE